MTARDTATPPTSTPDGRTRGSRGLTAPGMFLGLGLGGFVDGILLHQILQWHHMLSSTDGDHIGVSNYPTTTVAGLEMNTLWDGFFHVVTWVATLVGLVLLHRRAQDPSTGPWGRALWGWVLVGWGTFHLVEGIVDHHLLGIHHVRSGPHELAYDLGFLASGAVLVVAGLLLQRGTRARGTARDTARE